MGINLFSASLLQADAAAQGSTMSSLLTFLPFVAVIAIFYFLVIRPQNKKQKDTEKMISALKKGDKVVTIGGVHGVISSVKDKTVIVKVDENCKLEFSRSAIAAIEPSADGIAESDKAALEPK